MLRLGSQLCARTFINFVKPPVVKKESLILLNAQQVRNTSFFNRLTQEQLWKGVLSVSNAGKKKGRGRALAGTRRLKDKNLAYKPGQGKIRVAWPGLNTGVSRDNAMAKIEELPKEDETQQQQPAPIKGRLVKKIHPLERGWSGKKKKGVRLGPPEPEEDLSFDGFESIVLEIVPRQIMTSKLGRKRRFSVIVATGNGDGLIGLGKTYKQEQRAGLYLARARAAKRLIAIDLIEKHTVNHDFCSHYGKTYVFVYKKPKGYGLRCHRALTAICKLIGIQDLHARVEGPVNIIHMIRAFMMGLVRQKTYEQMANEKQLHLVEYKEETYNFPKLLASPPKCRTAKEIGDESVLFEEYIMDGNVVYRPEKKVPFYQKLPSWDTHLKRTLYHRNHEKVRIELLTKYGMCRSHLADIYPECTNAFAKAKDVTEQTD